MNSWEIAPISCKLAALVLGLILSVISILHFYWATDGKWGLTKAVPSDENGNLLFLPTKSQSGLVGFGLFMIVVFIFMKNSYGW